MSQKGKTELDALTSQKRDNPCLRSQLEGQSWELGRVTQTRNNKDIDFLAQGKKMKRARQIPGPPWANAVYTAGTEERTSFVAEEGDVYYTVVKARPGIEGALKSPGSQGKAPSDKFREKVKHSLSLAFQLRS